jgi:hypothetical protein
MLTELDEATMAWLEGHHIRPKDVRAWGAEARTGDVTVLTLEVIVSGVDEIGLTAGQECQIAGCPRAFGHTGKCWPPGGVRPQERIDLTGWSEEEINELHRTGVPPESRR